MSLSPSAARREIHHRVIDMKAYARDDGWYDVEARLVDRKPFPFVRVGSMKNVAPGDALHDLWVRMTVDGEYVVRAIEASSDVTPYDICKEAERTLSVLVGEKIARGWSAKVKERLRGAASCTHLMEMLIPLATTALQGIRGIQPDRLVQMTAPDGNSKVDSCYAYGAERELVQRLWPQLHRPPAKG
ncbi:MAG TPA: DUF2889 domain-containing protein [Ramlibacter sp.]|nr:DUF2889 domain-containing protein [Ramlibacter sp.]